MPQYIFGRKPLLAHGDKVKKYKFKGEFVPFFGNCVWWRALEVTTNHVKVESFLSHIALLIIGFISTTPTKAIFAILNWFSVDLQAKRHVLYTAISLDDSHNWHIRPYGHANILNTMDIILKLIEYGLYIPLFSRM